MKCLGIIQARMNSTRLPGKILMDLSGEPMLARVVTRLRRAEGLDAVLVATTSEPADDRVAEMCQACDWPHFRGSQDDVLDRFYQAASPHRPEVVVRITADCPLIDPAVVDRVIQAFHDAKGTVDLACNVWPRRTFPRGLDVEVVSFAALARAWREDHNPAWREHVTAFIYRRPDIFQIRNVENSVDCSHLRWTVDTVEDMSLVRLMYEQLGSDRFGWMEALELMKIHPEWSAINSQVEQKVV